MIKHGGPPYGPPEPFEPMLHQLTRLELTAILGIVRAHKDVVAERRMQVDLQIRTHGADPTLHTLHLTLENELFVIESLIAKLWRMHGDQSASSP